MNRKPIWINDRQVFVLPWARVWDILMAAPSSDIQNVWNGNAAVTDETGSVIDPDAYPSSGQKLFVRKREI
jgi:hypothetical protein